MSLDNKMKRHLYLELLISLLLLGCNSANIKEKEDAEIDNEKELQQKAKTISYVYDEISLPISTIARAAILNLTSKSQWPNLSNKDLKSPIFHKFEILDNVRGAFEFEYKLLAESPSAWRITIEKPVDPTNEIVPITLNIKSSENAVKVDLNFEISPVHLAEGHLEPILTRLLPSFIRLDKVMEKGSVYTEAPARKERVAKLENIIWEAISKAALCTVLGINLNNCH